MCNAHDLGTLATPTSCHFIMYAGFAATMFAANPCLLSIPSGCDHDAICSSRSSVVAISIGTCTSTSTLHHYCRVCELECRSSSMDITFYLALQNWELDMQAEFLNLIDPHKLEQMKTKRLLDANKKCCAYLGCGSVGYA